MADDSPLIRSLRAAVEAAPADVPLRLHLAALLLDAGAAQEAVAQTAVALQHEPASGEARELMLRAMGVPAAPPVPPAADPAAWTPPTGYQPAQPEPAPYEPAPYEPAQPAPGPAEPAAGPGPAAETADPAGTADAADAAFDWRTAEQQLSDVVQPRFVQPAAADGADDDPGDEPAWDIETSHIGLADVGGMTEVKKRLEAAFLAPMRNPELRRLYAKSLRGGLLLYGPPGCGKTFIARAVAGELGAKFITVSLSDVLDIYIGQSERNLHDVFAAARMNAPCVVFLDEIDALGGKRSSLRHNAMRGTVNQLLTELDGAQADNDGVFVLAATNHPWDVDDALRRPGRLDRTLLVLPPDQPAREAVLRYHLRDRPIEGVDLAKLAKKTEGYSGADLAHLCETAAEAALLDSAASGRVRMIGMRDLLDAVEQVQPSIESWFTAARNVAMFANEGGMYDDLVAYLKKSRRL
ncbi:ATP-binding protein [Streptacidiphilus sp. PB12-B1b]|uniref:ATP-binding protein n=1 Tax=Streptacidiphilus sp. PB12-B1b TaxID=2705012 RepID=UPI0015F9EBF3|nr:ATP-binding protein [Streptacidiphilus sp. PB12-B1b]QMU75582.1 ATP-binding protein [Streptacidiphilus sp. PB12-B1b]